MQFLFNTLSSLNIFERCVKEENRGNESANPNPTQLINLPNTLNVNNQTDRIEEVDGPIGNERLEVNNSRQEYIQSKTNNGLEQEPVTDTNNQQDNSNMNSYLQAAEQLTKKLNNLKMKPISKRTSDDVVKFQVESDEIKKWIREYERLIKEEKRKHLSQESLKKEIKADQEYELYLQSRFGKHKRFHK